ncbi:hypothetical protein LGAA44_150021 [Leuconostoc gasicomitatum]|nr:hypothetical protein LGAA44_150021 [Leuconostoc gasicomitatum]
MGQSPFFDRNFLEPRKSKGLCGFLYKKEYYATFFEYKFSK